MTSLFPFAEAMQFGFGVLHLSSADFWALTPRELRSAARAFQPQVSAGAPPRAKLQDLMQQFPDQILKSESPHAERIS